jgi:O-acetyl-ADP-ribose deacetylase (regulator of RNase III)
MTYTETTGDLFELGLPAIGHGCNTAGSMAGGIARDVRRRWPECYREYAKRCRAGRFPLGGFHAWEGDGIVVYNLATQVRPGRDARLAAIREAVTAALDDAHGRGIDRLGLPRIGAGIGGLEWADVRRILLEVAEHSPVELVVVERPQRPARPVDRP